MPNIVKSKEYQTMKFGQFIEYNMRNIFFEIMSTKGVEKLVLAPFQKVKIEYVSGSVS